MNPGEKAELRVTVNPADAKNSSMQPLSQSEKLFEEPAEGVCADPPAEGPRSVFARTGILPSQAIRAPCDGSASSAATTSPLGWSTSVEETPRARPIR